MTATSVLHSARSLMPLPRAAPPPLSLSRLATKGLGWFSILLGVLQVAASTRLAPGPRFRHREPLLRGHLRDLASLHIGRRTERHTARNISVAVGAVAGIALINLCVARFLSRRAR